MFRMKAAQGDHSIDLINSDRTDSGHAPYYLSGSNNGAMHPTNVSEIS